MVVAGMTQIVGINIVEALVTFVFTILLRLTRLCMVADWSAVQ